ncbi:undecaprenyl-diphosphatase [Clostridium folliculivorans]|uniref:Phosphatase n=1 Tax=Clostridium folliculivorans TaxID=2886038 RepID=A0A9W5Y4W5_9CLOT|nr:undecaprenyl-diphosphatase [Clostridium folliculivorans]GKU26543.1 phosphatase [Clostridium folliculivorans]GKU29025.1 phosphatase [Clostridium folliculivorans]
MNLDFFRLINNLANKNVVMDKIMIFFSKDVPYIFMAITAIVFFVGIINKRDEYRKIAFNTFLITLINLIISFIIGNIYYVNRPFVNNKVNLLIPHPADASFPSDHATGTMSIALGLRRYNKMLSIILMVLSLIVGFSRVYVGHHYPLDIIGAYIIVAVTGHIYDLKLRDKVNSLYDVVEKKIIAIRL